ncbi:MAG: glycogen synthase GlgA [Clostridia bacterium]|nr:glycogen synthase GlgA [Clostridia bacterium]
MKILYASSEAAPFVKTGGLGDVAGSLPQALREKGIDARVILPLYRCIPQQYKDKMTYLNHIYIDMAWRKQYCGVFSLELDGTIFYFVDNEYYFNGDKPYDYIHLDCEKFIFFSKAVLSLLPTLDFRPDVINCNDWQTGAIPVFLDTFQDNPFYRGIKTVMTVHNLKFQGRWNMAKIKDVMGISNYYFTDDKLEYHKDANLLKGGMVYADRVSTVSESYAGEITTEEYGEGLNGLLWARRDNLTGIVNGISYKEWNPETDPMIYKNYSVKDFRENKKLNKIALQEQLNIPVDENKFMIGIVSRLTDQKGFDLVAGALESLVADGCQIVILGTGDENYENLFRHYGWKNPDVVSANIYFSNDLSHKIYAACDAFLMPSRFEPCGLSQLISMRYGTLPIVRETGGLKDTVEPYNEYTGEGVGFSFGNYNVSDMIYVINYAMDIYYNRRENWNKIVENAMNRDFSWAVSADKYIAMYREITGIYDEPVKEEKKPAPKKTAAKKPATKKVAEKKPAAKKAATEKTAPEKTADKKTTTKKTTEKKTEKK